MKARALPQPLHVISEGLAFLLELAALGALVWWGADTGTGLAGRGCRPQRGHARPEVAGSTPGQVPDCRQAAIDR